MAPCCSASPVSRIGRGIQISGNDELESLSGLDHLLDTPKLTISKNPRLTSLTGLEGLGQVTFLDISGNGMLGSVSALAALKQVDNLTISGNPVLASLHGLEQVTKLDYFEHQRRRRAHQLARARAVDSRGLPIGLPKPGAVDIGGLRELACSRPQCFLQHQRQSNFASMPGRRVRH